MDWIGLDLIGLDWIEERLVPTEERRRSLDRQEGSAVGHTPSRADRTKATIRGGGCARARTGQAVQSMLSARRSPRHRSWPRLGEEKTCVYGW